jgi:hypothetical protein
VDGRATVAGVPPGTPQVVCSYPGLTTRVFEGWVGAGATTEMSIELVPGSPAPVYRFYQRRNGSHFYTASAAERDSVISRLGGLYTYEGVAYAPNRLDPVNSAPLYRFYNRKNGSHFYTASVTERDYVYSRLSATYQYDGPAYNVSATSSLGAVPVYRFYNTKNGSHFYTASSAEKNSVIRNLGAVYTFEGPAFWIAE